MILQGNVIEITELLYSSIVFLYMAIKKKTGSCGIIAIFYPKINFNIIIFLERK